MYNFLAANRKKFIKVALKKDKKSTWPRAAAGGGSNVHRDSVSTITCFCLKCYHRVYIKYTFYGRETVEYCSEFSVQL